jgi:hypothetical protein
VARTGEERRKAEEEIKVIPAEGLRLKAEGSLSLSLSILQPVASSLAQDSAPGAQHVSSPTPNTFCSEGEYWTLTFQGTVARMKDTRGMQYLAQLLQHPDHEISAMGGLCLRPFLRRAPKTFANS